MPKRQSYDGTDPELSEEQLEQADDLLGRPQAQVDRDLATEQAFNTQDGDGHTYNPHLAAEQGLTYTPPTDPPVVPSDDLQGAEVATGFGTSMEESSPDEEILPDRVDNNDLELAGDVEQALRFNSETAHLTDLTVSVRDGEVTVQGTIPGDEDRPLIDAIVANLPGVTRVRLDLTTAS